MAPWWKRRQRRIKVCTRCHGNEEVHEGLCRKCRTELLAEEVRDGEIVDRPPQDAHLPPTPSLEPAHDRPWVHRGGG